MRCASCNTNTPGKTLKGTDYRCPGCGHQFVAVKSRDGVSDITVKAAVEQVSEKGTLYYRPEHLAYQLLRRLTSASKSGRAGCLVVAVVLAVVGVIVVWKFGLIGMLSFVFAAIALRLYFSKVGGDVFELVQRYETVNPPGRRVPKTEHLIERERGRESLTAGLRNAGRILVCQDRHDAHFFIANDFHLQHACPVTGPEGKALDGFPELEQRLARPGALDLFVLHDFTPAGAGYLRRLRQLPAIVKRREPVTLIAMGFDERHLPLLESALLPLGKIASSSDASPGTPWRGALGAQVTALKPAAMLAAAGTSLADRAPIRVPVKDDQDGAGDGDRDSGDSE